MAQQSHIPSPDEIWEKFQKEKEIRQNTRVDNGAILSILEPNKQETVPESKVINKTKPSQRIPTPDQLWEQRFQQNRETEIPATIPDRPVMTDALRRVEAAARRTSNKYPLDPILMPVSSLKPNYRSSTTSQNEQPPIAAEKDIIPYELKVLESQNKLSKSEYSDSSYVTPLINPVTGLPDDKFSRNKSQEQPAIESSRPIEIK